MQSSQSTRLRPAKVATTRQQPRAPTHPLPAQLERVLRDMALWVCAAVPKVLLALWLPPLALAVGRHEWLDGELLARVLLRALVERGRRRGVVGRRVEWRRKTARAGCAGQLGVPPQCP